jgi:hypothetical protein
VQHLFYFSIQVSAESLFRRVNLGAGLTSSDPPPLAPEGSLPPASAGTCRRENRLTADWRGERGEGSGPRHLVPQATAPERLVCRAEAAAAGGLSGPPDPIDYG